MKFKSFFEVENETQLPDLSHTNNYGLFLGHVKTNDTDYVYVINEGWTIIA